MRMKGKKVIFSERDTWSLDETLEPVILAALQKFKEVIDKHGVQGIPQWAFAEEDTEHEDCETAEKNYLAALDLMIYAFDPSKKPSQEDFGLVSKMRFEETDKPDFSRVVFDVNSKEAKQNWIQGLTTWDEKCQEGREMFGKHFKSLWW